MKNILMITGTDYDDSEVLYPYYRLTEEEYKVTVAAPEAGEICGKYHFKINADLSVENVDLQIFDGLILPGGKAPEKLRQIPEVCSITGAFANSGKPIAAICHGQQILISAGVLKGVTATCYPGIKDDLINAGAIYKNEKVVVCGNIVTSRRPDDLPYFMKEFLKLF